MILISIKSPFMDIKHQEETDKAAEKYLKKMKDLHGLYLINRCGNPPNKGYAKSDRLSYGRRKDEYQQLLNQHKMKVEIINTEHNQLNFATQLK